MKYFNPQTQAYLSEQEIRALNPNTSFPQPFIPPAGYELVFQSPQPEHNAVTQSIREISPILTSKGHYEQQWEIIELFATQPERDAAIAADTEANRLASVPQSVTMRQARLALYAAGLLTSVDAAIAGMTEPDKTTAQITWEFAATVERQFGMVPQLAAALGMTDTQIDDLFIAAASL